LTPEPELTAELLLRAYVSGIFPMGDDDGIRWYSPDPRFIIDLKNFHVPRRLARTYRQGHFEIRIDTAWTDVIKACSERDSTWITDAIIRIYTELHQLGFAHSVEAFADNELVGGLYGVSIGGAFMGESMFHRATDASKVCLVYLVERLNERGYLLLDSQFTTNHLEKFGGILIPRKRYLAMLEQALKLDCRFV
jgi:leucyl/phenylalanyl-tRNA--protein transferase